MRTTLNLDDSLLEAATRIFPPGTPKTVILEEGLRQLVAGAPRPVSRAAADPRMQRLIDAGHVSPRRAEPPALVRVAGGIPLDVLLDDLAADREDR